MEDYREIQIAPMEMTRKIAIKFAEWCLLRECMNLPISQSYDKFLEEEYKIKIN